MPEDTFIDDLGFIVVAAAVFAFLARRIGMPSIVAYLIAGLFLGPVTGLVTLSDSLGLLSETGIALLLFLVGLELSLDKIRDVGRVAVVAGIGQVVFTAAGGLVLCQVLGFGWMESIFLAVALTFSSTVVVVKLLDEKGHLDQLYGRIAVGIFLVQDLVAIFILTFLAGLGGTEGSGGTDAAGEAMAWGPVLKGLGSAFGGMAALLLVALLAARYLLPRPFAWAARRPEAVLIWSLSWCFLLVMAAHVLHLSLEIGAFLAGIGLAQLPHHDDLHRRVHPIMNFCIAVFFVSLGVQMEIGDAVAEWPTVVALSLFVLIGNPLIFIWIIARMGYTARTSFFAGVTVAQISEFSFIVVALGVGKGLVGDTVMSQTALIGLVTITVSAYMIRFSEPLHRFAERRGLLRPFLPKALREARGTPAAEDDEQGEPPLSDHIVVVGMNSLGRELARRLHEDGCEVVAVDTDPKKLGGLSCRTVLGNAAHRAVLEHLHYRRARLLVSALRIDATNDLLAYRCRAAGVPCAIHVHDQREMDQLVEIGTDYLMISKVDGVKRLNAALREAGHLPARRT
jgi:Kef-type K+ transport system membrane component KefB